MTRDIHMLTRQGVSLAGHQAVTTLRLREAGAGESVAPRSSLGLIWRRRRNGITPLRLMMAGLVVFSHAFVLGLNDYDPLYNATGEQMQLGTVGVIGFFALSGFLLTASRERSDRVTYLRNRALRILPGLWVCLAVTVAVVVPLAVALGGTADPRDVARFIASALLFSGDPANVPGLYGAQPLADFPNSPLWTLSMEVACYLILCASPVRLLRWVALEVALFAIGLNVLTAGWSLFVHLPIAFMVGSLLYQARAVVPASPALAGVLVLVSIVAAGVGILPVVAPIVWPYVFIWAGLVSPVRWQRDVSYGAYIYGWPVQQLLAMAGVATLGLGPYLGVTIVVLGVVAYVSARLVEEPALRLRQQGVGGVRDRYLARRVRVHKVPL